MLATLNMQRLLERYVLQHSKPEEFACHTPTHGETDLWVIVMQVCDAMKKIMLHWVIKLDDVQEVIIPASLYPL